MKQASQILRVLKKTYPNRGPQLVFSNEFQLLIATILSAQTTDKKVNQVTKNLFKKRNKPQDFTSLSQKELEKEIHSTGFYKNKARNVLACCRKLIQDFNGKVPETMEELITLPGVGRKTANVVLSNAFNKNEGICVDTHVARLSQLIGLTKNKDVAKIEEDLMKLFPKKDWKTITDVLILHGRRVCIARKPRCEVCGISKWCEYY